MRLDRIWLVIFLAIAFLAHEAKGEQVSCELKTKSCKNHWNYINNVRTFCNSQGKTYEMKKEYNAQKAERKDSQEKGAALSTNMKGTQQGGAQTAEFARDGLNKTNAQIHRCKVAQCKWAKFKKQCKQPDGKWDSVERKAKTGLENLHQAADNQHLASMQGEQIAQQAETAKPFADDGIRSDDGEGYGGQSFDSSEDYSMASDDHELEGSSGYNQHGDDAGNDTLSEANGTNDPDSLYGDSFTDVAKNELTGGHPPPLPESRSDALAEQADQRLKNNDYGMDDSDYDLGQDPGGIPDSVSDRIESEQAARQAEIDRRINKAELLDDLRKNPERQLGAEGLDDGAEDSTKQQLAEADEMYEKASSDYEKQLAHERANLATAEDGFQFLEDSKSLGHKMGLKDGKLRGLVTDMKAGHHNNVQYYNPDKKRRFDYYNSHDGASVHLPPGKYKLCNALNGKCQMVNVRNTGSFWQAKYNRRGTRIFDASRKTLNSIGANGRNVPITMEPVELDYSPRARAMWRMWQRKMAANGIPTYDFLPN